MSFGILSNRTTTKYISFNFKQYRFKDVFGWVTRLTCQQSSVSSFFCSDIASQVVWFCWKAQEINQIGICIGSKKFRTFWFANVYIVNKLIKWIMVLFNMELNLVEQRFELFIPAFIKPCVEWKINFRVPQMKRIHRKL